jgi:chromosome segregation ATPase
MTEKETPAEDRKSALESDYAPLYAVAGLTDALAEALKGALAETQQKASKRISDLQSKRPELSQQAKTSAEELRTFVITLPEQFKHLPEATKARIAELQKQANELLAQATNTYGEYADRGKHAVDEARKSARARSGRATKRVTPRSTAKPAETRTAPAKKTTNTKAG